MITERREQHISLRISVTDRCPSRCVYCLPPEGAALKSKSCVLSYEEIVRFVRAAKSRFGLSKVHLTGGEPLIRPGIVDLVAMLGAEDIDDLAMTTNAHNLVSMAEPLKRAGLDRINVSLDSLDDKTFESLTRGRELKLTLDGIAAAREAGFSPIKLNTVVLRGHNHEQVTQMARWAIDHGCEIRFLEVMPIGPASEHFDTWFVSSEEVRQSLGEAFTLVPVADRRGSSSRRFTVTDDSGRDGIVGFISSHSGPFCSGCRRVRLTACGTLVGCLALGESLDIKPILRSADGLDDDKLNDAIASALSAKRDGRPFVTKNLMNLTGG